jgi:hypothetical protein
MYRRNVISDESCSDSETLPTKVGWQWTPTVVGKVGGPQEVAPGVPIRNKVVLPGRLLHTLLTPRTLIRSAYHLTIMISGEKGNSNKEN